MTKWGKYRETAKTQGQSEWQDTNRQFILRGI